MPKCALNTNVLELCKVTCLEWQCLEAKDSMKLEKAFKDLEAKGYFCALLTHPTPSVLWVFYLNKQQEISLARSGLKERFRFVWKPDTDGNGSTTAINRGDLTPEQVENIHLTALSIFHSTLQRVITTAFVQSGYEVVQNTMFPTCQDKPQFYRPSFSLHSDIATAGIMHLGIRLNYFLSGNTICVCALADRKNLDARIQSDTMPSDAVLWMYRSFMGLENPSVENHSRKLNLWEAPMIGSDGIIQPYLLAPGRSSTAGTSWRLSGIPTHSSRAEGSKTDVSPRGPRKRPQLAAECNDGESNSESHRNADDLSVSESRRRIDKHGNLGVFEKKKTKEENPILAILEQQVEKGFEFQNDDAMRHKRERITCPPQYMTPELNPCRYIALSEADIPVRKGAKRSRDSEYTARSIWEKTPKGFDEAKLQELVGLSKPVEGGSTMDIDDTETMDTIQMKTVTLDQMKWASVLLNREALIPWRHSDDRWLAMGSTNPTESATLGERIVVLNKCFTNLVTVRRWLDNIGGTKLSAFSLSNPVYYDTRTKSKGTEKLGGTESWLSIPQLASGSTEMDGRSILTPRKSSRSRSTPRSKPEVAVAPAPEETVYATPKFLVGFGDNEWLNVKPDTLSAWEAAKLRPHVESKDVEYVVLCPETSKDWVSQLVKPYLQNISAVYQDCGLGDHTPARLPNVSNEIIRVSRPSSSSMDDDDYVRPFYTACKNLRPAIENGPQAKSAFNEPSAAIVIYVVSPFQREDQLNTCRLMAALASGVWGSKAEERMKKENLSHLPFVANTMHKAIVFEILYVDQLIQLTSLAPVLREVSFAVFNKVLVELQLEKDEISIGNSKTRQGTRSATEESNKQPGHEYIYRPVYILGQSKTTSEPNLYVHCSYSWSRDKKWLAVSYADVSGSLCETQTFHVPTFDATVLTDQFHQIWDKATSIGRLLGASFKSVSITRKGYMPEIERQTWFSIMNELTDESSAPFTSTSLVSIVGKNLIQLIPKTEPKSNSGAHHLECHSYGCISRRTRYTYEEDDDEVIATSNPNGIMVMNPRPADRTPPSALGGAVLEDVVAEHATEITLEINLECQYVFETKWKVKPLILTESLLSELMQQFHDMSWLTFHPVRCQRHSPFPYHVAAADSLSNLLGSVQHKTDY